MFDVQRLSTDGSGLNQTFAILLLILLSLFTAYFLGHEVIQIKRSGAQIYFSNGWNYVDIIPLCMTSVALINSIITINV